MNKTFVSLEKGTDNHTFYEEQSFQNYKYRPTAWEIISGFWFKCDTLKKKNTHVSPLPHFWLGNHPSPIHLWGGQYCFYAESEKEKIFGPP